MSSFRQIGEDEPSVLSFATEVLRRHGYSVLEATDGRQALSVSNHIAGPIQLMITDVVMPEMGGQQLARALGAARPEMKVRYVSGYTESTVVRQGVQGLEISFLQKPFSVDALLEKVRQILDAPSNPEGKNV